MGRRFIRSLPDTGIAVPASDSQCFKLHSSVGILRHDVGYHGRRRILLHSFCLSTLCGPGLSVCRHQTAEYLPQHLPQHLLPSNLSVVIYPYARNNRLVLSPRLRSRICIRSQRDYHRYYIPLPLAEYDARLQGTSRRNPAERDAALFISHLDFGYCRYLQSDSRQDSLPALV